MWGLRPRPGRGPRPSLTLDQIVAAAVALADAGGIEAVSMSKVAQALGTAPMSLYRYVDSKDELFMLMVDSVGTQAPTPATGDEGWRVGLRRWAESYLDLLHSHTWIVRVPISTPPITPRQIAWLESGLQSLKGTGLTSFEKISTVTMLSSYVRAWAQLTDDISRAAAAVGSTPEQAMEQYLRTLVSLIADRFPEAYAAMSDPGMAAEDEGMDADFIFGLNRQLDGLESLIRSRESNA